MTFEASPRAARVLGALRFGLLSVACLGLAHDAVFAAEHGFGAGFAAAMSAGGHDGYWTIFSVVVVFAVTVLGLTTVVRLGRLGAAGRRPERRTGPRPLGGRRQPARPYRQDLRGLWFPLLALTATAFTVQENLEHLLGHGHLIGLSALVGPEYPLALPTIALVTLAAAALGALVRWRIAALEACVTTRPHMAHPRTDAVVRPAVRWLDVAAIVAHARFLTRPDAERAPPRIA